MIQIHWSLFIPSWPHMQSIFWIFTFLKVLKKLGITLKIWVSKKIVCKCSYCIGILWKLNYYRKYINKYQKNRKNYIKNITSERSTHIFPICGPKQKIYVSHERFHSLGENAKKNSFNAFTLDRYWWIWIGLFPPPMQLIKTNGNQLHMRFFISMHSAALILPVHGHLK